MATEHESRDELAQQAAALRHLLDYLPMPWSAAPLLHAVISIDCDEDETSRAAHQLGDALLALKVFEYLDLATEPIPVGTRAIHLADDTGRRLRVLVQYHLGSSGYRYRLSVVVR